MPESASRGGGVWSGGVSGLGGGWCLLRGGCLVQGGLVSGLGGGVCLVRGVVSAPGGVSQYALRQTPLPPVDRQTPVKILPWPNFVAAGKYRFDLL